MRTGTHEVEARHLVVVHDTGDHYYLDTAYMQNRKPLFFGAVRKGRQYVSYHLMPVYMWPELLADASPSLRARMQGRSCFNFKGLDPLLMQELRTLTERGFARYREQGFVH